MTMVLQARQLARYYTVSQGWFRKPTVVKALDGVSFDLEEKKTLAVVGESGCGKSTLARQLALVESASAGRLQLDGMEVTHAPRAVLREARTKVQMVFQSPYASLNPRRKIGDQLSEGLLIHTALTRSQREEAVQQMMSRVGLRPEYYYRYPHMFSGGQRQRIAIARAMMLNPKVVIADEPTSALDVSIQAQVLNLLMDLQETFNTAYVFISHNLAVVEYIADEIMVMYLGRVVERATKTSLYRCPLHPYTQALLSATPSVRTRERGPKIKIRGELPSPLAPPTGCAFHTRCPYAKPRCQSEVPVLREWKQHWIACHRAEEINV